MLIHFPISGRKRRQSDDLQFEECFNILTLPDLIVESNETFALDLSSEDDSVLLNPQSSIVTILDNDGMYISVYSYVIFSLG